MVAEVKQYVNMTEILFLNEVTFLILSKGKNEFDFSLLAKYGNHVKYTNTLSSKN